MPIGTGLFVARLFKARTLFVFTVTLTWGSGLASGV